MNNEQLWRKFLAEFLLKEGVRGAIPALFYLKLYREFLPELFIVHYSLGIMSPL